MPKSTSVCCSRCKKRKLLPAFPHLKQTKDGLRGICSKCYKWGIRAGSAEEYNNARRKKDPAFRLWLSTYCSSYARKLEHKLSIEYLRSLFTPTCPYFEVELSYELSPFGEVPFHAATVDRIDNDLGYVPGNVRIVSMGANRLKSNFNSERLLTLAKNILRLHS